MSFQGFWKMSRKYWRTGLDEYLRSFSKKLFLKALQEYVPDIRKNDLERAPSVRAQALDKNGNLIDDFLIEKSKNIINVINAPSPAATSCFAIGKYISKLNDYEKSDKSIQFFRNDSDKISILDLIITLSKNVKILIIFPLLTTIMSIIYVKYLVTPIFESTAKIILISGNESNSMSGIAAQFGINLSGTQSQVNL